MFGISFHRSPDLRNAEADRAVPGIVRETSHAPKWVPSPDAIPSGQSAIGGKRHIAKTSPGASVPQNLARGTTIQTEGLSYQAFPRRFGRALSVRAPKEFLTMLTQPPADGLIANRCLQTTRAPAMAERMHRSAGGVVMQRDLFSAASCVTIPSKSPRASASWPGRVRNRSCGGSLEVSDGGSLEVSDGGRLGGRPPKTNRRVEALGPLPLAAFSAVRVRAGRPRKHSCPNLRLRIQYWAQAPGKGAERATIRTPPALAVGSVVQRITMRPRQSNQSPRC